MNYSHIGGLSYESSALIFPPPASPEPLLPVTWHLSCSNSAGFHSNTALLKNSLAPQYLTELLHSKNTHLFAQVLHLTHPPTCSLHHLWNVLPQDIQHFSHCQIPPQNPTFQTSLLPFNELSAYGPGMTSLFTSLFIVLILYVCGLYFIYCLILFSFFCKVSLSVLKRAYK